MSITQTTTLSAHTARALSEFEHEEEETSSISSADRTAAVDSIQLEPFYYKELSLKDELQHQSPQQQQEKDEEANVQQKSKTAAEVEALETMSKQKRRWLIFKRIAYIVIMNAAIPIALYYILKPHLPAVWALVLSSTPTIISVIVQAIFMKRIDSIGVAVVFGFILSVILAVINGDPKLLLMRESFVTAGVGVVCAITLIPIRIKSFQLKPVLYYLARDLIPLQPVHFLDDSKPPQPRMEFFWQNSAYCRFHFRLLTAIDVVILEIEFGLKLFYILHFDIDTVVVLSNSTLSVIGIIVSLSTIGYILQIRKRLRKDEPNMLIEAHAKNGV